MSQLLDSVGGMAGGLKEKAMSIVNSFFPPEKRAEMWAKFQNFVINNPKISVCEDALEQTRSP